ncbi:MAG: hypothetical protein ABI851_05100 [Saprospiraceae bacterium]
MKNTWNNLDRIEAWKNNELDAESKKEFEFELMHNSELSNEVEVYHDIVEQIDAYGDMRAKKAIHHVVENLEKEGFFEKSGVLKPLESNQKSGKFRIFALAASLALVVVASFFVLNRSNDEIPQIAMYQFEKNELNIMIDNLKAASFSNADKGKDDSLAYALTLYTENEFAKAKILLLKYISDYPEDLVANLTLGLAYKEESQYGKAAKYLSPLTRIENFERKNMAKWNLWQCYSKFDTETDLETAKRILQELIDDPKSGYVDYAKPYLFLLNGFK